MPASGVVLLTRSRSALDRPSPRKRSQPDVANPPKRRKRATAEHACPHSMTILHYTRVLTEERNHCPICLEEYFDTPPGRDQVIPAKMDCQHIFCRSCIEGHRSHQIKCPLPWCHVLCPLEPDTCELCAYWFKIQAKSLVLTVRANEMTSSIDDAMLQLAQDNSFFQLSKGTKRKFLAHIRRTLRRFEWQYHPCLDLAELLDPFLTAVDPESAHIEFGPELSAPAPESSLFPPREHDPDDYPLGKEPWIVAFLRQWAQEYEKENGEAKEGWGVWARKFQREASWSWEWPYKRIIRHKTEDNGIVLYLVKWVGKRYPDSWVNKEELGLDVVSMVYDETHGVQNPGGNGRMKKRKRA